MYKNVFLNFLVYFQNCAAIKKNHYGFKAYPCPNILIPLAKWTIYASILKYKQFFILLLLPKCGEGNCAQLFRPWSGISEVRTADSYGPSEFMLVWMFNCVCVSQSSVFWVFVVFCQPLNIYLFVMLYLYMFIIYCY